ncbi:MAG: SulP family sulfate permease [Parvicellaceae bacterium]|jgi:SulP family sulfate permease
MSTKTKFFDFSNLKGDLLGGLTAGIVALPLALAFGVKAFEATAQIDGVDVEMATMAGAKAGLYGAMCISILAALFGGTPTQISGPTAPMTTVSIKVIAAAIITLKVAEEASGASLTGEDAMLHISALILATFMFAGLLQILFGVIKIGKFVKYIPQSVVSGFMSGIGVIIIITQIFPFFDFTLPKEFQSGISGTVDTLLNLGRIEFNWYAAATAGVTILIIYLLPRLTKILPSALVALVVVSAGCAFVFTNGEIMLIPEIPAELPQIHTEVFYVFSSSELMTILGFGTALAFLGMIDSLLTSIVADNITKTKHNSDRELIGQGIGNTFAGLLGGLPGAGATMRTVVNIDAGGKTKISGIVAGILILLVVLVAGPLVQYIPKSVLSGILITVGIGIIDYRGIKQIGKIPKSDSVIMILVLLVTTFYSLIWAVVLGMAIASLNFMKTMSDIGKEKSSIDNINSFKDELFWSEQGMLSENVSSQVFIKHLYGPLFFGFASSFSDLSKDMPDMKTIVIRFERVPYIDQSGFYALESAISDFKLNGCDVLFTGLEGQPKEFLEKIGLVPNVIDQESIFKEFGTCAKYLKRTLTDSSGKIV